MKENKVAVKNELIQVYGRICFMNQFWVLTKNNPLTGHHIIEARNGGKYTFENIALLSLERHQYLNYLDNEYHKIYNELNCAFYDLKKTYAPPKEDYYEEINHILRKLKRK